MFERKVMRKIYGPIENQDGGWIIRSNEEKVLLVKDADIARHTKAQRIRWNGHNKVNDQLDALFLNVFVSCLYMFRATSAHHQEDQIVLIHHLV